MTEPQDCKHFPQCNCGVGACKRSLGKTVDPLVDRGCVLLDGACDCARGECKRYAS